MIGDLYIYSDNLNGDTNIVDLSSNNFTITKYGIPYHSTSYTSTTPRFTSCIYCPNGKSYSGNTGVTLGTDVDFTFDIYVYDIYNNTYDDHPFAGFGMISFEVLSRTVGGLNNQIILYNANTNSAISNAITFPCLITITRQGDIIRIFENGVFKNISANFDMGTSYFGVGASNSIVRSTINTVRIVNGISLYNSDFAMPTFPYTDGESITGQVTESDIGVARTIRLYNRTTGELTYTTTSNVDGTYEIPILNNDVEYDVVFLDDTAGNTYNDIIQRTSLI